jgi:hypothetical protein
LKISGFEVEVLRKKKEEKGSKAALFLFLLISFSPLTCSLVFSVDDWEEARATRELLAAREEEVEESVEEVEESVEEVEESVDERRDKAFCNLARGVARAPALAAGLCAALADARTLFVLIACIAIEV